MFEKPFLELPVWSPGFGQPSMVTRFWSPVFLGNRFLENRFLGETVFWIYKPGSEQLGLPEPQHPSRNN